ncbi:uncharacterized protein J3D65DRAFT_601006 [Phyllosticta citribraziliensis]|uniref:Secreted protein n=1 Tax=Phyllosticta citribraziliensis TaxID=989973 RepID=A0ABR1M0B9_9PEZI
MAAWLLACQLTLVVGDRFGLLIVGRQKLLRLNKQHAHTVSRLTKTLVVNTINATWLSSLHSVRQVIIPNKNQRIQSPPIPHSHVDGIFDSIVILRPPATVYSRRGGPKKHPSPLPRRSTITSETASTKHTHRPESPQSALPVSVHAAATAGKELKCKESRRS